MKARLLRKDRLTPGTAPGVLNPPKDAPASAVHVIAYDVDHIEERGITSGAELSAIMQKWPVVWINVDGLGSVQLIEELGGVLGLHVLALEDAVSMTQRPKAEDYDDFIFLVMRMVMAAEQGGHTLEQFSLFLGKNYVLTFQERPGDLFGPVRERLRKGGKRIRMVRPDYLAYALLDAVIDGYFPVIGQYGDRIDALEEEVLGKPSRGQMADIHRTKRELQVLRHCIWPMREVVSRLSATRLVHKETAVYLRDCQDHVTQIFDLLETYRERASGLTDFYVSAINFRINEVMKVLTLITTIFMPLSFIAGIYGMNFDRASPHNMPELGWEYGYYIVLGGMAAVALLMLIYFHVLGWFRDESRGE